MGVYPEGLKGFVPEDIVACLAEEPFRWTEVIPTAYSTEDPLGSTTIMRLSDETGKTWMLEVDYQQVLDYLYVSSGTGFALPERPYLEQIDDWKHGYMWGRFKLASNCGTIVKRTAGFNDYGHFFWVKYKANLYELVPDPTKAVIELEMNEWIYGALDRFKRDAEFREGIFNRIAGKITGYRLESYSLEDNKLSILVARTGSPAIPVIVYAILAVLSLAGITVIVWKILDYYQQKLLYEQEANNQDVFNSVYENMRAGGYSEAEAVQTALRAVDTMKVQQDGYLDKLQLIKYAKYGAIGLGTLMALGLVRDIVKR